MISVVIIMVRTFEFLMDLVIRQTGSGVSRTALPVIAALWEWCIIDTSRRFVLRLMSLLLSIDAVRTMVFLVVAMSLVVVVIE